MEQFLVVGELIRQASTVKQFKVQVFLPFLIF